MHKMFRVTSKANIKPVGKFHRFVQLPQRYVGKFYTRRRSSNKCVFLIRLFDQVHFHYLHHSPQQSKWINVWNNIRKKHNHMDNIF